MLLLDEHSLLFCLFSTELSLQGQRLSGQGNWRSNWLRQQPNCSPENEENSNFGALLGQISISPYANQLPGRGRTKIRSREGSTRKMGSSSELQFLQSKSRAERNFGGGNFLFQTKRITPRVTSRFRRLAPQVDKYYRHKSQGKLSLLYKV
jgi:hypothetical protein